jgi:hypothetical protein
LLTHAEVEQVIWVGFYGDSFDCQDLLLGFLLVE